MDANQLESELLSPIEQLEQVKLDKQTIEDQEKRLLTDIERVRVSLAQQSSPSSVAKSRRKNTTSSTQANSNRIPLHLDSQGRIIKVGDVVKFLTYTNFKGFHGRVTRITKHRIISVNYEGSKVMKESRNIKIVPRDTNLKDGYTTP